MEHQIGMGLSLAQSLVIIVEMIYKAEPVVYVYTTRISNATTLTAGDEYGIGPLFLTASLMVILFAFVSQQLHEQGIMDNASEYCEENVLQTGLWNTMFWVTHILIHLVVILRLLSPVCLYQALLILILQTISLAILCNPRSGPRPYDTLLILCYGIGSLLAFQDLPHGSHIIFMSLLILLDVLLLMGHVYDQRPNMQTIGNCRLLQCASSAMLMIGAY